MMLSTIMKGLLLATVVGPSLAMGMFNASSMAAGSLGVSLLYVCIFMAMWNNDRPLRGLASWVVLVVVGTGVLYFQGAYSFFAYSAFDYDRFSKSHVLLIVYTLGAYCFVALACRMPSKDVDGSIRFVFWILIFSAISGLVRFSPFFPEAAFKSVLFYGEPSHFAIDFLPVLLYMVVRSSGLVKIALLIASLSLSLLLENLTLLVGLTLIFCITIPPRLLLRMLPLLPVAILVILSVDFEYYAERLDLSSSTSNLSALVYMQGLERAYLNLVETGGFGTGFQQFGIVGSTGEVLEKIKLLIGYEANLLDGGAVAQKFIGEFGVLGLLCVSVYLGYFLRSAKWLFKESASVVAKADPRDVFFHSCFVTYVIDLLIRGEGYFSSSGFLFFAALFFLFLKPFTSAQLGLATVCWPTTGSPGE